MPVREESTKKLDKKEMSTNAIVNDDNVTHPRLEEELLEKLIAPQAGPRKYDVIWKHVVFVIYLHLAAVYGLYLMTSASWITIAFNCVIYYLTMTGITAGAHRLWTHRSYKAKKPLQIFLMLCYCFSGQFSIFIWARDHRIHHKYSDTDADPHNATRGFFFSHLGWLLVDRHPEIYKRGKLVDMSDILSNPVLKFQRRHQALLNISFALIIPMIIPVLCWHETLSDAHHLNILRVTLILNAASSANSLSHMFGTKPYDKGISPTQNIVATLTTLGEGFHNYHHTFPQDYKAGELGSFLNFSTSFINFCVRLGLAYDLKSVPEAVVQKRMLKTGDGTRIVESLERISSRNARHIGKN